MKVITTHYPVEVVRWVYYAANHDDTGIINHSVATRNEYNRLLCLVGGYNLPPENRISLN
ncbi:hypothetical protein VR7878_00406 [Vibrio ruber DSM 16370]|uniref:Uncharacterized protein n=1 Tax=Vibrio ruber (strain DSM 16370 / JCM 11486 / BCRC 17186 / CECT 7878 / LMG 23124 / VR1) TaxID=1123498 RepID=A0A1R4LAK8_VIBR1|nr:hypothetical protein VR7878_00406 [Vibrio ruber DSM 16370]